MPRSHHPLRLGLFVLGGLALLLAGVILVGGGRLFAATERGVLHFDGSVYGLQVGAPVVLRGVRVGSVIHIGLRHDEGRGGFLAPVVVTIDKALIRDADGQRQNDATTGTLAGLVQRGLQGELATQSLLTGQLYVDLTVGPPRPAADSRAGDGLVEIPTRPPPPSLQAQLAALAGLDLKSLVADLSAIASAARQFVGGAEVRKTLADLSQLAASLARASATLEQRVGPLAQGAQGVIAESRQAALALGQAAERVGVMADGVSRTADKLGRASERAEALLSPDAPLARSLQQAAEQIAASATALRQAAADEGQVMQGVEGTLAELRRTSRAVRSLAELLEREPEAVLRGRRP